MCEYCNVNADKEPIMAGVVIPLRCKKCRTQEGSIQGDELKIIFEKAHKWDEHIAKKRYYNE